jgi:hypothetical protein
MLYPEFWPVTGDPWYLGYKTPKTSYFTSMIKLYGQWDPRLRKSVDRGWTGLLGRSSWLPSAEMDDARDGFWRHCFVALTLLDCQDFPCGGDVDGLAYPLHSRTTHSRQSREQSFLSSAALSHRATVGGDSFLGDAKLPSLDI